LVISQDFLTKHDTDGSLSALLSLEKDTPHAMLPDSGTSRAKSMPTRYFALL
jgi:hypothetical protein